MSSGGQLHQAERGRATRRVAFIALPLALLALSGVSVQLAAEDADIDLSRYELVFNEEFETLDVSAWGPGTRWIAHTPWGGDFGDALFVDPEPGFPFTIEDGVLRIEARKGEDDIWRSGLLASTDPSGEGFSLQYGYFEMRAKLPPGPGVWPAFWLIYNRGPDASLEIDVMEYYGHQTDIFHSVVHVWPRHDGVEKQTVAFHHVVPPDSLIDSFNDYGVSVDEDEIVFFLNGKELARTETPGEYIGPLFILLNLALGSGWPIENTINPSYMYVEHVRAYRPKP